MKKKINYIMNLYFNLKNQYKGTIIIIFIVLVSNYSNNLFLRHVKKNRNFMKLESIKKNIDNENNEIVKLDENGNILGTLKTNLKAKKSSELKYEYIDSQYNYLLDDLSDDYYFGNDYAPINVVVYSSFECPYCLDFHKDVFSKLKENYIDTKLIRYVNRMFIQKNTLYAVVLPYCVPQKKQLNTLQKLYEQLSQWKKSKNQMDVLEKIAINNGLTVEEFESCERNVRLANNLLEKQKNDKSKLGITGTPTIFVNHRKINGSVSYKELSSIIDEELNKVNVKKE